MPHHRPHVDVVVAEAVADPRVHGFHTGPEKGWPDVAYNFFVDLYGTVWEGRAGSLAGPVKPDATGGSQGFSQICCFIGAHTAEAPTAEAQRSMTLLLAGLAQRYGIDPGASTAFVSRGSDKWPAGAMVTTTTIAGHRDMSQTTCPGDAAYPLVRNAFPAEVAAVLGARATPAPSSSSPPAPASTSSPATPSRGAGPASPTSSTSAAEAAPAGDEDGVDGGTLALVGAGAAATGAAAVLARHLRGGGPRRRSPAGLRSAAARLDVGGYPFRRVPRVRGLPARSPTPPSDGARSAAQVEAAEQGTSRVPMVADAVA